MRIPEKFPRVFENQQGRVKVYRRIAGGRERYDIAYTGAAGRVRETRSTWEDAARRANEILQDFARGMGERATGSAGQWDYYRRCEALLAGRGTLEQAVAFFLAHSRSAAADLLSVPCAEWLASYEESRKDFSRRHVVTLRHHIRRMRAAHWARKPAAAVTVAELDLWLGTAGDAARTRANIRTTLVAAFRWARDKGYVPDTGRTEAEKTEVPREKVRDPEIIGAAELRNWLAAMEEHEPRLVPWLALGAFAGIREAERGRLRWSDIDLEHGIIALPSDVTKTSRRRTIPIVPALAAWLRRHAGVGDAKVVPLANPYQSAAGVRDAAGLRNLPHNALRHSFATYHYLLHRNAQLTASILGNSVAVMESAYNGLAKPADADEWFASVPPRIEDTGGPQTPEHENEIEKTNGPVQKAGA